MEKISRDSKWPVGHNGGMLRGDWWGGTEGWMEEEGNKEEGTRW